MFIQMNNARKSYGKGESTVHALDGIELALEPVSYTHLTLPTIA